MEKIKRKSFYVVLLVLAFVFAGLFYMEIKAEDELKITLNGDNIKIKGNDDVNIIVDSNSKMVTISGTVSGLGPLEEGVTPYVIWSTYIDNASDLEKAESDYIASHSIVVSVKGDGTGTFEQPIEIDEMVEFGKNKKIYFFVTYAGVYSNDSKCEATLGLTPEIILDSYDHFDGSTYYYENFKYEDFLTNNHTNRQYYIKGKVSNPHLMENCLYWNYGTQAELDVSTLINDNNAFDSSDSDHNYVMLKEITKQRMPFVIYYTDGNEVVSKDFGIQIPSDTYKKEVPNLYVPWSSNIKSNNLEINPEVTTDAKFAITLNKSFSGYSICYKIGNVEYEAAKDTDTVKIGPNENVVLLHKLEETGYLDVQFYLKKNGFVHEDPVTVHLVELNSVLSWDNNVASNGKILLPQYNGIGGTVTCAKIQFKNWKKENRVVDYKVLMSSVEFATEAEKEDLIENYANSSQVKVLETEVDADDSKSKISIDYEELPKETGTYYFYLLKRSFSRDSGEWSTEIKDDLGSWTFEVQEPQHAWLKEDVIYEFPNNIGGNTLKAFYKNDSIEVNGILNQVYDEDQVIWTDVDYSTDDYDLDDLDAWVANETVNVTDLELHMSDRGGDRWYNYSCSLSGFDNASKTIYFYVRREVETGRYIYYYLDKIVFEPDTDPEFIYDKMNIKYNHFQNDEIILTAQDTQTGLKRAEVCIGDNIVDFIEWGTCDTSEQRWVISDKLSHKAGEKQNYILKIYDWTGNSAIYSGLLENSPEITVEPANTLETLGKEDYFYAATRNTVINVDILKNKKDANNPTTKYLTNVEVIVNGVTVENISLDEEDLVTEYKYDLNLSNTSIPEAADKKYNIMVKAKNDCGCYSDNNITVEIDDKKPVIGKIMFGETAADLSKLSNKGTDYVFFSNASVNSKFDVSDIDSTGLKNSKYYWLDSNKNTVGEKVNTYDPYKAQNIETVTRDGSYKSFLYLSTEDAVGNFAYSDGGAEQYVTPGGIIIDLPDNHNKENHLSLSVPTSTQKDEKGNPLFNSSVTIGVEAIDTFAGIRSVEWNVSLPNDSSKNSSGSLTIDNTGKLSDGTWRKDGSEANLVTKVKKDITISGNSNNIVLYVKVTDNAGNVSDASTTISIDTVSPKVSIAFNDVKGDATYTNYYNQARTATITVQERNFDASSANAIITNSIGNTGTLSQWSKSEDTKNPDNTTYTAKVTFDKDDTYNLSLKCGDTAGNGSETVTVQEFVIDTVKPEMTLTFLNDNGKNGYHSAARVATLFVKELNFDADRIHVEGNTIEAAVTVSAWTKTAQGYTATVSFAKDGIYDIKINGTDKAGNVADTVVIPSFTIDTIDPEITVEGLNNKTSNNGKVAPVISFKDINIDKSTIKIELSGLKNGKMDIEDWYTVSDDGLTYTFKNIANKKELDDLYTMKITSADKSGNVSTQTLTFSVNRFGSIYVFGDELKKINNKYVKKVSGLELTEINVDELDQKTIELTLTINGVPKTLKSGTDYKIQLVSDDAEWKNYRYVLSDSLFKEDGSYILTVYSKDKAGNENENVDADKDSEIKFGIDATAPIVAGINVESNHFYDTNGMVAIISVKDNMILENVEILVDGKPVEFTNEDEMYSFDLPESNMRQAIEIRAKDSAGNLTVERIDGVLVSGNFFIKFMHNKIAIAGTVLGGAALALAGILFMIFKKK